MIATFAFNMAGGMTRPAGGYIFGYAVFAVIVGLVYKALGAGERAQSNLLQPDRTMEVFVAGIFATLTAAYLARRFAAKQSLFEKFSYRLDPELERTARSCMIVGSVVFFYLLISKPPEPGSLFAIVRSLLNGFLPISAVLGVIAQIRRSGGTRSIDLTVFLSCSLIFFGGLIGFSKEGFFTPTACWLIAAASQRYKISILQILGLAVFLAFVIYYLVPYSQYGRNYKSPTNNLQENLHASSVLLSNLGLVRKLYYQGADDDITDRSGFRYFDKPAGLFDRLQMIAPDDAIIDITENGIVFGFAPTIMDIENVVPHFIWKDKPAVNFGNIYAHEIGILTEDDDTTGISFSPSGEAYHQGKWIGVLILLPVLLFFLFWVSHAVAGDLRRSPIGLVSLVSYLHAAPEGGIGAITGLGLMGSFQFIVAFFFIVYVLPLTTNLLLGPPARDIDQNAVIASKRRRPIRVRTVESTVE